MRLLLESIDETSLSGVVAFGGRLGVVAFAGSGGCLLKVSVTTQTLAHDVLLPFSNIAWFLSSVVVHFCGNYVGSVVVSSFFLDHHVRIRTDAVFSLVEFASSHHECVRKVVPGMTQRGL